MPTKKKKKIPKRILIEEDRLRQIIREELTSVLIFTKNSITNANEPANPSLATELAMAWAAAAPTDPLKALQEKIESSVDLTPPEFPLPSPHSYFAKDEDDKELLPGFTSTFLNYVKSGMTEADAYQRTCERYERPAGNRRSSPTHSSFSIPTVSDIFEE
jgi:hypothetical protein